MRLKFKDGNDGAPALQRTPPNTPAAKVTGPARCGHQADKLGPPQFRKGMLANIAARDCPACRKARQDAERAAAVERWNDPEWVAERKAKKQRKKEAYQERRLSRLPDGARFDVTYDAASTTWTGTLAIGSDSFRGTCSGVFGLLRKLDQAWRSTHGNSLGTSGAGTADS